MIQNSYIVETKDTGERIDKYIAKIVEDMSRASIQKLLQDEKILVNHKPTKANYRIQKDDQILVIVEEAKSLDVTPSDIPLDIVYEDDDIIIINKEKDRVVHPSAGHQEDTLVNGLLFHRGDTLSGINGVKRPGIVHRIDKDTTGLLVICKNDHAHNHLANQLKEHSITRKYRCIVYHNFKEDHGTVHAPIGRHPIDRKKMSTIARHGKDATTHYCVLERLQNKYTYLECTLETGRTHQIRVHLSSIGHPLLGDTVYGPSKDPFKLQGQVLHAGVLGFTHPSTKEYMEFEAPLPVYFSALLDKLRN